MSQALFHHVGTAPSSHMDEAGEAASNRRRRGLGVVTPNACVECRKKRAKCDGQTPCGRCVAQDAHCVYEVPVRQSKEMMRNEIEELQNYKKQTERVLRALSSNDSEERFVVGRLRAGQTLQQIAEALDRNQNSRIGSWQDVTSYPPTTNHQAIDRVLHSITSLPALPSIQMDCGQPGSQQFAVNAQQQTWPAWGSDRPPAQGTSFGMGGPAAPPPAESMNWTGEGPQQPTGPLVGTWHHSLENEHDPKLRQARDQGQNFILGDTGLAESQPPEMLNHYDMWTRVTDNSALIEHLMALYFCWEYPTFASLSKEHFIIDFRVGRPRYCSPLLVNALLAVGCRFSNQPEARADPNNHDTAGDLFFDEAKRLLAEDKGQSLTKVQALGLMSIREASYGRDTESWFYSGQSIRIAVEMGLHQETKMSSPHPDISDEQDVRAATFWGAFALDQAWSLMVGKLPHFSQHTTFPHKPSIIDRIEASEWVPYTDDGMPLSRDCKQPSNVHSVFQCFCELSEIIHETLYVLYAPDQKVTSTRLIYVYSKYLNWYNDLPVILRLGQNFTPSVLFAHMYYHAAILLLFRPFIKLRFVGSGVSPRDVCSQSAETVAGLIQSFQKLYTLRRTPAFVPYIVLTSSIVHLASAKIPGNKEPILQAGEDLRMMCGCHGFAKRALLILKILAQHWEIDISLDSDSEEPESSCDSSSDAEGEPEDPDQDTEMTDATTNVKLEQSSPRARLEKSELRKARRAAKKIGKEQRLAEKKEVKAKNVREMSKPSSMSMNMFVPVMGSMQSSSLGPASASAVGAGEENPVFSPFPMQGTPLLALGNQLLGDGFDVLPEEEQSC